MADRRDLNSLLSLTVENIGNAAYINDSNIRRKIQEAHGSLKQYLGQYAIDDILSADRQDEKINEKITKRLKRGAYFEAQYIQMNLAMLMVITNAKDLIRAVNQIAESQNKLLGNNPLLTKDELNRLKEQINGLLTISSDTRGGGIVNRLLEGVEESYDSPFSTIKKGGQPPKKPKQKSPTKCQSGGFVRDSSSFPAQEFEGIDLMGLSLGSQN